MGCNNAIKKMSGDRFIANRKESNLQVALSHAHASHSSETSMLPVDLTADKNTANFCQLYKKTLLNIRPHHPVRAEKEVGGNILSFGSKERGWE